MLRVEYILKKHVRKNECAKQKRRVLSSITFHNTQLNTETTFYIAVAQYHYWLGWKGVHKLRQSKSKLTNQPVNCGFRLHIIHWMVSINKPQHL